MNTFVVVLSFIPSGRLSREVSATSVALPEVAAAATASYRLHPLHYSGSLFRRRRRLLPSILKLERLSPRCIDGTATIASTLFLVLLLREAFASCD